MPATSHWRQAKILDKSWFPEFGIPQSGRLIRMKGLERRKGIEGEGKKKEKARKGEGEGGREGK